MRAGLGQRLAYFAAAAALCLGAAPAAVGSSPAVKIDIEMAFDTTGSMSTSLSAARQNAVAILTGVRGLVPNARFAVVSFRDHGNPGGEYKMLQSMTTNTSSIRTALDKLHAVSNPSPSNLVVESYNLAFHRAYTDASIGWRPDARKVLLVIGDAEPYGGGAAGLGACSDTHVDPDGLNVRTELSGLRTARITLVMIRAVSPLTTTSLDCYRSLVGLSYPGGSAQDASAKDLVTPIVALVGSVVAPISVEPSLPLVLPGKGTSVKLRISNPNSVPLQLNGLTLRLPAGFVTSSTSPPATGSGPVLTWGGNRTLAPREALVFRVTARAGTKHLRGTVYSTGHFQLSSIGPAFASSVATTLHVTRSVLVRVRVPGRPSLAGSMTIAIPRTAASPARTGGVQRGGSFVLKRGSASVVLRPDRYSLLLARGRAAATLSVHVSASGVRGCPVGSRGVLTLVDRSFGVFAGAATAQLQLPSACGANSLPRSTVAVSMRPS